MATAISAAWRAPLRCSYRRPASLLAVNAPRMLQRQWRGYASSLDNQQKVSGAIDHLFWIPPKLTYLQLLSADLENADPTVYKIIEKVRRVACHCTIRRLHLVTMIGEEQTKAFHKSYPVGELHITGRTRCIRERHAKFVFQSAAATRLNTHLVR